MFNMCVLSIIILLGILVGLVAGDPCWNVLRDEAPYAIHTSAGNARAATTDPTDTYPEYQTAKAQSSVVMTIGCGASTANTPPAVATPFPPPLPSRNTGLA